MNARALEAEIRHKGKVLAELERALMAPFDDCEVVRMCGAKVARLRRDLRQLKQRADEFGI